jgi:hypothetical protein
MTGSMSRLETVYDRGAVKHSSTRSLYAYWNERRGTRAAPERGEIEPGAIRNALGDSFVLSTDPSAGHVFRLAGTRVCSLFGREIKGEGFPALWQESDREAMRDLLAIVANEIAGIVAGVSGVTAEGHSVDLELLLLPLRHRGMSGRSGCWRHSRLRIGLEPLRSLDSV